MTFFNKTEKGVSLEINDEIGFWGVTHQDVKNQLDTASDSDIHLNIASLGGDVNHAFAIYNMLKSHKGRVVANIYGDAASAATLIALGADEVRMADNVFFMIHNVWTMAVGDSGELRQTADLMDKFNDQIKDLYKKKTGMHKSKITSLMNNETWFTAKEAKEHGFVDSVTEPEGILNRNESVIFNSMDKNLAKELINKINNKNSKTMEINEQSIADKVVNGVKDFFNKKEETVETPVEPKAEINVEDIVNNAVNAAIEATKSEVESLRTQLAEKETEAVNAKADADKVAEENAKLKAATTTVEASDDTAETENVEEFAYVNSIKNLVKKVKQLN
jgi:ATP-dependent protease ClpP protease subunit